MNRMHCLNIVEGWAKYCDQNKLPRSRAECRSSKSGASEAVFSVMMSVDHVARLMSSQQAQQRQAPARHARQSSELSRCLRSLTTIVVGPPITACGGCW